MTSAPMTHAPKPPVPTALPRTPTPLARKLICDGSFMEWKSLSITLLGALVVIGIVLLATAYPMRETFIDLTATPATGRLTAKKIGSKLNDSWMDLTYEYEVDGTIYTTGVRATEYQHLKDLPLGTSRPVVHSRVVPSWGRAADLTERSAKVTGFGYLGFVLLPLTTLFSLGGAVKTHRRRLRQRRLYQYGSPVDGTVVKLFRVRRQMILRYRYEHLGQTYEDVFRHPNGKLVTELAQPPLTILIDPDRPEHSVPYG